VGSAESTRSEGELLLLMDGLPVDSKPCVEHKWICSGGGVGRYCSHDIGGCRGCGTSCAGLEYVGDVHLLLLHEAD
jgi:hypothetical protein